MGYYKSVSDFAYYLKKTGEVGEVEQAFHSIVLVRGLPHVKPSEIVVAESGELGEVFSLTEDYVEVLMFSPAVGVGTRMTRTDELLSVGVGEEYLGRVVDSLGFARDGKGAFAGRIPKKRVDIVPAPISARKKVDRPFETGVSVVDLVVPLGLGQRELVIGDHKVGKTPFLMQSMMSHAKRGGIVVYGGIARRMNEVEEINKFLTRHNITDRVVHVVSLATDPSGLIYLTPYTATTMAEFFRDAGHDVLLILDDMTIHAKYYREISLLARRFPGRGAYPGDIYYLHAKILERAGSFKTGTITCLAVAETVFGDITGYIQSNLMSMTDGHILFDHNLSNLGRKPAVNPFLSVSRVGHQTQSPLMRSLTLEVTRFLVYHERVSQLVHFGGEINQAAQRTLDQGERVLAFFNQENEIIRPTALSAFILGCLWAGFWEKESIEEAKKGMGKIVSLYEKKSEWAKYVDALFAGSKTFDEMVAKIKKQKGQMEFG